MNDIFDIAAEISEKRANGATQWLFDNRDRLGQAKAERDKADNMLRVVKSLIISQSDLKTVGEREAEAYSHRKYKEAIETLFEATRVHETLLATKVAATALIDMWRSKNSALKAGRI